MSICANLKHATINKYFDVIEGKFRKEPLEDQIDLDEVDSGFLGLGKLKDGFSSTLGKTTNFISSTASKAVSTLKSTDDSKEIDTP